MGKAASPRHKLQLGDDHRLVLFELTACRCASLFSPRGFQFYTFGNRLPFLMVKKYQYQPKPKAHLL